MSSHTQMQYNGNRLEESVFCWWFIDFSLEDNGIGGGALAPWLCIVYLSVYDLLSRYQLTLYYYIDFTNRQTVNQDKKYFQVQIETIAV